MVWLLTEILVFVAAGVVFGVVIGLGLAGTGTKRRAAAFQREHQDIIDRARSYERSQHGIEAKAVARAAAEAAARGDLEARLVEMEAAAADYRARAEAAERRLHLAEPSAAAPEAIEAPAAAAPDARALAAEGDRAASELHAREIESLRAQLALAERARARAESDLAVAQARAEESLRTAMRAGRGASEPAAGADPADSVTDVAEGERPPGLPGPRDGKPDDLRRIRGIGPKNEGVLNALGIYHYEQIAALTGSQVAWLDNYLKFHGRIARDDWVGQAQALVGAAPGPGDKVHPQDVGA
jgi:predicted flap endonuclease-1-like 5' DNA nuclease